MAESGAAISSERILIGKIVGCFGLQGWVKILSHTEPKDNIFSYEKWWLKSTKKNDTAWLTHKVHKGKKQGKGLIVRFKDIDDRTQAEELLGMEIYIDPDQLSDLPEGEFYWKDLIGLQVLNEQGVDFGQVKEIMATGANDVLVIHGVENDPAVLAKLEKNESKKRNKKVGAMNKASLVRKETLVPYIWEQVIKQVDLDAQQIIVAWDEDYLNE